MQIQKGPRIFFCSLAVELLLLIFACHFLFPALNDKILEKNIMASEYSQRLMEIQHFYGKHKDVTAYGNLIRERKITVDKMLPEFMDVNNFVLDLQLRANNTGVSIKGIKPGAIKQQKGCYSQGIVLSFQANFYQLHEFLFQIEQNDRFVEIQEIRVRGTENSTLLEGNVHLLVFAMKE